MRSLGLLLSLLVISIAACGKVNNHTDGGLEDAATFDADLTDDDAAPADAAPDAPTDIDGRPPEIDGGGTTQGEVCGAVCQAAVGCFPGKVDLQQCLAECPGEIGDCSQPELETLAACSEQDCKSVFACLEEVPCLGGGDSCGNESCDEGESCETCESDCGPCDAFCGDGACGEGESCESCETDCGSCAAVCGDGVCAVGECTECGSDCPDGCVCPHDACTVGVALDPGCGTCEAQVCAADGYCCNSSWDFTCAGEAETICGLECPATCGDGLCEPTESCDTCATDCGVCVVCGDGTCAVGECAECASDCPDGCNCPHDTCTPGVALDPGCGSCAATICAADSYCCNNTFDGLCVGESESLCGLDCPAVCGDSYCDPLENPTTCATDCEPLQ